VLSKSNVQHFAFIFSLSIHRIVVCLGAMGYIRYEGSHFICRAFMIEVVVGVREMLLVIYELTMVK